MKTPTWELDLRSTKSGNAFQTTCDMTTDGGGWTEVSFPDAQTYLNGAMSCGT